jgi:hypothetical protein
MDGGAVVVEFSTPSFSADSAISAGANDLDVAG